MATETLSLGSGWRFGVFGGFFLQSCGVLLAVRTSDQWWARTSNFKTILPSQCVCFKNWREKWSHPIIVHGNSHKLLTHPSILNRIRLGMGIPSPSPSPNSLGMKPVWLPRKISDGSQMEICRLPDVDDETWSEVRAFVESNPDTVTGLGVMEWWWFGGDVWYGCVGRVEDGMKMKMKMFFFFWEVFFQILKFLLEEKRLIYSYSLKKDAFLPPMMLFFLNRFWKGATTGIKLRRMVKGIGMGRYREFGI